MAIPVVEFQARGYKIPKIFLLKLKIFTRFHGVFWNEIMASLQNLGLFLKNKLFQTWIKWKTPSAENWIINLQQDILVSDTKSLLHSKSLIKSEWFYEIINFPKYQLKNLKDFCPEKFYRIGAYVCQCALCQVCIGAQWQT